MAAVDDKMKALEFNRDSVKSRADIRQLLNDASQVAQGEKIILTESSESVISGVARNFVRIQHAVFSFSLAENEGGGTRVNFQIADYMRTRQTFFIFIPVSPWTAPAYKTLKEFSEYVTSRL